MKKRLIQLALIFGLFTLTCVAAQATEAQPTSGLKNVSVEADYRDFVQIVALDASDKTAVADKEDDTLYPGAAKIGVTYQNPKKDSEYLLIVLSDDNATPSVDNMAYIDQKTAGSSDLDFTIYPKKPDASAQSVKYSIYMSSSTDPGSGTGVTGYVKVASFEYYSTGLNFTLGDVNDDEKIDVSDAVLALQAYVGTKELDDKQFAAADVTKDEKVDVSDAVKILQYYVGTITSFD